MELETSEQIGHSLAIADDRSRATKEPCSPRSRRKPSAYHFLDSHTLDLHGAAACAWEVVKQLAMREIARVCRETATVTTTCQPPKVAAKAQTGMGKIMSNTDLQSAIVIELTADIVGSYVANNSVQVANLPELIASVHSAIAALTKAPAVS